jgi:hypothetical protein
MDAPVRPVAPAVELVLAIELVGEHPAGLEVGAQIAAAVIDQPLGLGVARLEDQVPNPQLAEQARIVLRRTAAAGVQRPLAI